MNLAELLHVATETRRDEVFLDVPGGPTLTYRDVDDKAARMVAALRARGVSPGERLVAQVDKSVDAVALYLACLRTGAVYLPLNTAYTAEEVDYFVDDAEPALVVARPDTLGGLGDLVLELDAAGTGSFAEFVDAIGGVDHEIVERRDDDLAAMLYTSGTTGRSKGAMLTHHNLATNGRALQRIWAFQPDDTLLHTLPVFHVHGLFVALHCAMLSGARVTLLPRFDVEAVIGNLPEATVMMGVPTHYARLLADDRFDRSVCAGIRLLTSGSAPMTAALHEAVTERTGLAIVERYGMTEAGIITSNPYRGVRVPGTVGFALPDVELRVVDDDGRPVASDTTGTVEIRSPGLFAGYWRLPDKTAAEHTDDGYFRTGDVGHLDHEGRLTLEGRAGDMIISGGFNVYPKEIELVLDEVNGVAESAVIGVPHPDFGEAVVAVVVTDGVTPLDDDLVRSELDARLARFKHPKHYDVVTELPRNAMSKVQKSELRRRYSSLFDD